MMINKLEDYCQLWNLEVNTEKSKVLVFKKGSGRTASNEQWKFGEKTLEVVKSYMYLGMEFTFNLKLDKHLKVKLNKAKSAICVNWQRIYNNKLIAFDLKHRVFNATAQAILFYGAQVWGVQRHEVVEYLLRFFLRKIFFLPINTPKYMYYLETGLPSLFIATLKLNADYLTRVLRMDEQRLPRIILEHAMCQKTLVVKEWNLLAADCGFTLNWSLDAVHCKKSLYEVIAVTDENERYAYIEKARSSTERQCYSKCVFNLNERNYFTTAHNSLTIGSIFKIRGELIKLNFRPHHNEVSDNCTLCNLHEREDVLHFIGVCPILMEIRRAHFGKSSLQVEEVTSYLNGANWMQLYEYYKEAMSYRTRIIEESF